MRHCCNIWGSRSARWSKSLAAKPSWRFSDQLRRVLPTEIQIWTLYVFQHFSHIDAQEKEMCLHMAFAYFACYILKKFGDVYLQWGKSTIAFTFQRVCIDFCVCWAKAELHSHVVLSRCLRENLPQPTANACKELLQSARDSGIAQSRGGPKASYLKTMVLSLV